MNFTYIILMINLWATNESNYSQCLKCKDTLNENLVEINKYGFGQIDMDKTFVPVPSDSVFVNISLLSVNKSSVIPTINAKTKENLNIMDYEDGFLLYFPDPGFKR